MGMKTVGVALDVWLPFSSGLVQKVPAQVCRDTCVHTAHDSVEDSFFQTLTLKLQPRLKHASIGAGLSGLLEDLLPAKVFEDRPEVLSGRALRLLRYCALGVVRERGALEAVFPVDGLERGSATCRRSCRSASENVHPTPYVRCHLHTP